jgi:hypothetical protein
MLALIQMQLEKGLTQRIVRLATELAEQAIEREWETMSWSNEVVRDDEGSLLFTGGALEAFKKYYEEYFDLLSNELLN